MKQSNALLTVVLAILAGVAVLVCADDAGTPLNPPRRILPALPFIQVADKAQVGGYVAPDGEEIQCMLPEEFHLKNRGGSDGAGLCVDCSVQHACIYQRVRPLEDFFKWHWDKPGGSWPDRVDKDIAQICQEKGVAVPDYIQAEDRDNRRLISLFTKTGRMVGATYGYSPTGRYNGQKIAHMISIAHCTPPHAGSCGWVGVLDNNFPRTIEWTPYDQFLAVHNSGAAQGWIVGFLNPGPPPVPKN